MPKVTSPPDSASPTTGAVLKIDEKIKGFQDLGSCEDDFTIYLPKQNVLKIRPDWKDALSINARIEISRADGETFVRGRALVALCHEGAYYSVTVRDDKTSTHRGNLISKETKKMLGDRHLGKKPNDWQSQLLAFSIEENRKSKAFDIRETQKDFLYSFDAVIAALRHVVFDQSIQTGLIVIAGTTGCGKSTIARGLIRDYLLGVDWSKEKRRPHLVTIEEPIETMARKIPPQAAENHTTGWDYTPRLLGTDVKNLKQALRDAKRMKPAVVYVGETRKADDWKEIVDFAGSGHLIITTTHASSLVESVQRIFRAVDALTPAGRGAAAQSILAAIHLEQIALKQPPICGVVPAVWKRSTSGSLGLVADGLASVLPGNPPKDRGHRVSSLGKCWFAQRVQEEFQSITSQTSLPDEQATVWRNFAVQAAARDLVSL